MKEVLLGREGEGGKENRDKEREREKREKWSTSGLFGTRPSRHPLGNALLIVVIIPAHNTRLRLWRVVPWRAAGVGGAGTVWDPSLMDDLVSREKKS